MHLPFGFFLPRNHTKQWRLDPEDASTVRLPGNAMLGTVADPSQAISHFCRDKRALNLIVLMPVIKVGELVGDCSSAVRSSPAGDNK